MAFDKRKSLQAALTYTQRGQLERAIAEYEAIVKADPKDLTIYNSLGDLYARTGKVAEAIKNYLKLGELYRADGLAVKAIAVYKKIIKLEATNAPAYVACADLYLEQGLLGEAKIQLVTVAEHYLRGGLTKNALEIYQRIADLDPGNYAISAKLADLLEKEGRREEAQEHIARAAEGAMKAGQAAEAQRLYRRLKDVAPRDAGAALGLGQVHHREGRYAEAVEALKAVAAAEPENVTAWYLLGDSWRRLGDHLQAEKALRRALHVDRDHPESHEALARVLLAQGRAEDAAAEATLVADRFIAAGRADDLVALFRDLAAADPKGIRAHDRLAELYQRLGRGAEARQEHRVIAQLYEEQGNAEAAAAMYRGILEEEPQDVAVRAHLERLAGPGPREGAKEAPAAAREAPAPAGEEPWGSRLARELEELEEAGTPAAPVFELELPEAEPVAAKAIGTEFGQDLEQGASQGALDDADEGSAAVLEIPEEAVSDAEYIAEAEVYLKYGLVDKAIEHLQQSLATSPHHIPARAKLKQIYLDQNQVANAIAEGLKIADLHLEGGDLGQATTELQDLLSLDPEHAGVRERLDWLAGKRMALPAEVGAEVGAPMEAPMAAPGLDEAAELFGAVEMPEAPIPEAPLDLAVPASPEAPVPAVSLEALEVGAPALPEMEVSGPEAPATEGFPLGAEAPATPGVELEASPAAGIEAGTPPAEAIEAGMPPAEAIEAGMPPAEAIEAGMIVEEELPPGLEALLEEPEAAEPVQILAEGAPAEGLADDLAEAEFYIEQAMYEEAKGVFRRILQRDPNTAEVRNRLQALEVGMILPAGRQVPPIEPVPQEMPAAPEEVAPIELAPGAFPPVTIPPMAEEVEIPPVLPELAAALPEAPPVVPAPAPLEIPLVELGPIDLAPAPPPPKARGRAPAAAEVTPVFKVEAGRGGLDEGGFIDLGAELERELTEEEREEAARLPKAPGLEEILREFQKGVREQLDAEDYKTHYDLGLAYKEMDLLDEAIEEFRLAGKDPARALSCSNLIGLCYLAKRAPDKAVEELWRGLELQGFSAAESMGLKYDLATAYESLGDEARALVILEGLVQEDPRFRDALARARTLREKVGARKPAAAALAPEPAPQTAPEAAPQTAPEPAPEKRPKRKDKISFV